MDSVKTFRLELEAESYQIRDVLRAVLHTILFHRLLSEAVPQDVNIDFLRLSYAKVQDLLLDKEVDAQIRSFQMAMESAPPVQVSSIIISIQQTIELTFFQKKEKKGWLFKTPCDTPWEKWIIRLSLHQPKSEKGSCFISGIMQGQKSFLRSLERQLRAGLLYISTMAMEYVDHIPAAANMPYQIAVPSMKPESWGRTFRKIVSEASGSASLGQSR